MFSFEYNDWENICSQVFNQKNGRKKIYAQWYPFSLLSKEQELTLKSEIYFESNIKSGIFLYQKENWVISNNYIMKDDGNFRNASLISPIFYLVSLMIGKAISKKISLKHIEKTDIYYAGSIEQNDTYYKEEYDTFHKAINFASERFAYFIKTDIKEFYQNIDLNILFEKVNKLSIENCEVTQKDVLMYKELLFFMGHGEFPLLENCVTTSYLATRVYLESTDRKLANYIREKESAITDFEMIRYVDDLYILFNLKEGDNQKITTITNRVLNYYSSELKLVKLSLNRGKTLWKNISEINSELKHSLYDEVVNGLDFEIISLVDNRKLIGFLNELKQKKDTQELDNLNYTELIYKNFKLVDIEYTPTEVYNTLVYTSHDLFKDEQVIQLLTELIEEDNSFLTLDARRLIIILLKTNDGHLIKKFLKNLFESNRKDYWNVYDTTLALNYLVQRNFKQEDLLKILEVKESSVYKYLQLFCRKSFLNSTTKVEESYVIKFYEEIFYKGDNKLFFLYLMYKTEREKGNYLTCYAYYKNFFDRITAHFAEEKNVGKGPNYKKYYKEGSIKEIYTGNSTANKLIKKAHKLRNTNPVSHASSEIIDSNEPYNEILDIIEDLEELIKWKIETCK